MTTPRHECVRRRAALGVRPLVVVDATGELARLLLPQGDRATELLEPAHDSRNRRAATSWCESVVAWRLETIRMLAVWFGREVLTEFAAATRTPGGWSGSAGHSNAMQVTLRNGAELIRALYSTQTAYREGRMARGSSASARPGSSAAA